MAARQSSVTDSLPGFPGVGNLRYAIAASTVLPAKFTHLPVHLKDIRPAPTAAGAVRRVSGNCRFAVVANATAGRDTGSDTESISVTADGTIDGTIDLLA